MRVENAFSREPGKPCRYVQDAMLDVTLPRRSRGPELRRQ